MATEYVYTDDDGNEYVYEEEPSSNGETGLLGGDNATIQATAPQSLFSKAFEAVFGNNQSPLYRNSKGELVQNYYDPDTKTIETLPETDSQQRARRTSEGMGLIASSLPAIGISSKIPAAASLFGRVFGNYLPAAAAASATGIGLDKIEEAKGTLEATSSNENIDRFGTETAIGTLLPVGIEGVSDFSKWAASKFTNPQRTARLFGAVPTEMNPNRPFPVQDSINYLEENSPFFRQNILSSGDLEKTEQLARSRLSQVGKQIQNEYAKSGAITTPISAIENRPEIQKLINTATNEATAPKVAGEASAAYEQIMGPLERIANNNSGKVSIADLWTMKKSIDDIANLETINPSLSDEMLSGARVAIKDVINEAIERANPQNGNILISLNNEYHHLSNVQNSMARGVGKWGGQVPFVDDATPLSLRGTLGKFTGLGTNTGRAAAFNLGQAADVAKKLAAPLGIIATQGLSRGDLLPNIPINDMVKKFGDNLPSIVPSSQAEELFPQSKLLPRDTERLDPDNLSSFLMLTAQTPQAAIAQGLVDKFRKAYQSEDMDTIEKVHSDMTRLFPDLFEPGVGVNGKIFYPDEQAKYMSTLKQLSRMGKVDNIQLAKQQNAFNNPQDSRVLPLDNLINNKPKTTPEFYNGTRVYGY